MPGIAGHEDQVTAAAEAEQSLEDRVEGNILKRWAVGYSQVCRLLFFTISVTYFLCKK